MHTAGEGWGKFFVKAINTFSTVFFFFFDTRSVTGEETGELLFCYGGGGWGGGAVISTSKKTLKVWDALPMAHPDLAIMKALRWMLDILTVILLKRMSESFFFKAATLQHVILKLEKRWKIM